MYRVIYRDPNSITGQCEDVCGSYNEALIHRDNLARRGISAVILP